MALCGESWELLVRLPLFRQPDVHPRKLWMDAYGPGQVYLEVIT